MPHQRSVSCLFVALLFLSFHLVKVIPENPRDSHLLDASQFHQDTHIRSQGQLFLVRSELRERRNVRAALEAISQYMKFLPPTMFMTKLRQDQADEAANIDGVVEMVPMKPSMKMSMELQNVVMNNDGNSTEEMLLHVLFAGLEAKDEILNLCDETVNLNGSCRARIVSARAKIVLVTNMRSAMFLLQSLAQHPLVLWVEERKSVRIRNKYASGILQGTESVNISARPVWASGLLGDDEIIGMFHLRINLIKRWMPRNPRIHVAPNILIATRNAQASRTRASIPTRASSTTTT